MPGRDCGEVVDVASLRTCGARGEWIGPRVVDREPEFFEGCEYLLSGVSTAFESNRDFAFLSGIRVVEGGMTVTFGDELVSLTGLESVEELGQLVLRGNPGVVDLEPLGRVRRIHGLLAVDDNPALASFEGLSELECVGQLQLRAQPGLRLAQMEQVRTVLGDCELTGFDAADVRSFLERVDINGSITVDGVTSTP